MKIGLVTICDLMNYGNRLQNYALSKTLSELGHDVTTLNVDPDNHWLEFFKKRLKYSFHRLTDYRFSRNVTSWKRYGKRRIIFRQFTKHNTPTRWIVNVEKAEKDYDSFVLGGDQVWNTNFWTGEKWNEYYLLSFVEQKRKIAYSCSFGISEIPSEWQALFREELPKFDRISVREKQGRTIAEELSGRDDVRVVVDPVMLLEPEQWKHFALRPKKAPKGNYMFCFFLGQVPEEQRNHIDRFAERYQLEIVDLMDPDGGMTSCSPQEFVWLIEHASLVLTDSFHAAVFSFLLDRPFRVLERLVAASSNAKDMFSRFETLTETFGLQNNLMAWEDLANMEGAVLQEHVPPAAYEKLSEARAGSLQYLTDALQSSEAR